MEKKDTAIKQKELLELFGVKINPVMDFFFIPKWVIVDGLNKVPEGYQFYKEEHCKSDGTLWQCYIHKATRGVFSDKYWKVS